MSPWQPGQEPQLLPGEEEYNEGSPSQLSLCNSCLLPKYLGLITEQLEQLSVVWVAVINSCLEVAPGLWVLCTSCNPDAKNVSWQSCPHAVSHTKTLTTVALALRVAQKQSTWWWQIPVLQVSPPALGAFLQEHLELCDQLHVSSLPYNSICPFVRIRMWPVQLD